MQAYLGRIGLKKKNLTRGAKMRKINQIVVPVDFAYHSDRLVEYAAYVAEKFSAVVHFIHAVEFYLGNSMTALAYVQQYQEQLLADEKIRMAKLVEDNRARCQGCTGQVLVGDPVDEIVDFAKAQDADLIIMNTHGSKGLEKIMLGSVAEHVLKRAHCPVLIMNPFRT
jgi:nucleotide-binding universal stress UspA family protein